jgi:hypothetical protein
MAADRDAGRMTKDLAPSVRDGRRLVNDQLSLAQFVRHKKRHRESFL